MRVSVSKRAEFCIFKVSNSPYWQAKFYDYEKSLYICRRSTGVKLDKPKREAEKIARQMLAAGVLTATDTTDTGFIDYLTDFWQPDGTYALKQKQERGKPISPTYIKNNLGDIRLHIAAYPPFGKMRLADVTLADIEDWRVWCTDAHGITANRTNAALKLIKIAMSQAEKRKLIPADPTRGVKRAAETGTVEKGIIFEDEAEAICALPPDNPRRLLPVLLGLKCYMRRGEVRGLQWQDIKDGYIDLRHNWIDGEGMKLPKNGKTRIVEIPPVVQACLDAVRASARHIGPEDFVLESLRIDGEPVTENHFRQGLAAVLNGIGITPEEQKRRNLTPHGLRHSCITLALLAGAEPVKVMADAGHSDLSMTEHYTHAIQAARARRERRAALWAKGEAA